MKNLKLFFLFALFFATMFIFIGCGDIPDHGGDKDDDDDPKGPFSVTIEDESTEWLSVDKTSAMEGETVTVTVHLPEDLEIERLIAYAVINLSLDVTKINESKYTFVMVAYSAIVKIETKSKDSQVTSAHLDGSLLKWDAYIKEDSSFRIKIEESNQLYIYAAEGNTRELELANFDDFSRFSGKLVEISIIISDSRGSERSKYTFRDVIIIPGLPLLNAPTELKVENNILSWKWVDVDNECGGFIVIINDRVYPLQYYPYFNLDIGYYDTVYDITVLTQGISGKSNTGGKSSITYVYKVPVYKITFNLNNGTPTVIKDTIGGQIENYTPERAGYIFNGWYTSNDEGETLQRRVDQELITKDLTLYADWVEKENTGGIQKLPKPKVTVLGTIARWQAISGTNGYNVKITLDNETLYEDDINDSQMDISYYVYEPGKTVTLKVRARGNGETTANSDYTTVYLNSTVKPEDFITDVYIDYNIGIVYWKLKENAEYYVNGFQTDVYDKATGNNIGYYSSRNPEFIFTENLPAGEYILEIYMNGIETEVKTTFVNIRLNTPKLNYSFDGENWIITWDAIRYADSYVLNINGDESITEDTHYIIPANDVTQFSVKARQSSADYIMSRPTKLTITVDDETVKVKNPDQTITWLVSQDDYVIDEDFSTLKDTLVFMGTSLTVNREINFNDSRFIIAAPNLESLRILKINGTILDIFKEEPEFLKTITIDKGEGNLAYEIFNITSLEIVNFGPGYTGFGWGSVHSLPNLKELNFSDDLLFIDKSAFEMNMQIINKVGSLYYLKANGNDYYALLEAKTDAPVNEINANTKLLAQAALRNTTINEDTFSLPEGLLAIGPEAFYNTNLSSISFPTTLIYIGESAFHGCMALTTIIIPENVRFIENRAFYECNNITDFYINGEIEIFGLDAIPDSVRQLTIENGIRYLGNETNPYYIAYKIEDKDASHVTLHENCIVLGNYLFNSMNYLEEINLPKQLKYIGAYAFHNCNNLLKISLPQTVVLYEHAFWNSAIKEVYYAGTIAQWNETAKLAAFQLSYISVHCTDGDIIN